MDDGVELAYDLYTPDGAAPAAGRPAVVVMHGLGGSKDSMAQIAQVFRGAGYAALAFSVRGQGTSTGDFELASSRDVADMQAMVRWLKPQPGVGARVGCFGISLGGGECWNATPTGIFDAVVPVATWTSLGTALWPGNVARSGIVAGFAQAVAARSPLIREQQLNAVRSTNMSAIAALTSARSVVARLEGVQDARLHVPGPRRLRLRRRPGAPRLHAPRRAEEALRRRLRPSARDLHQPGLPRPTCSRRAAPGSTAS